ncbi:MAG: hypothetical protein JRJ15_10540 [Deltaproteobacteria bacterium]|nr:hypothetical protein [Deltaproteobacteria bacterium]
MKRLSSILSNERGSPLVIVLLVLVLLTLIGRAAINISSVETEMAGQHRRHKMTFYGADGGTEIACELVEQNIGCPTGFTDNTAGNGAVIGISPVPAMPFGCPDAIGDMQGAFVNTNWTDACSGWPHTLLTAGGNTVFAEGSAIQQNAGYEGKGKGSGGGGGQIIYNIFSRRIEDADDFTISIRWRHAIGQEGGCNY